MNVFTLFLVLTAMVNPFLRNVSPSISVSTPSILLDSSDYSNSLIYEETHRVLDPEIYSFMNNQILFMAYSFSSDKEIESTLIYIKHHPDLYKDLIDTFGPPVSYFDLTSQLVTNGIADLNYRSIAWKDGNYSMMLSLPVTDVDSTLMNRIWIKKLPLD